MSDALGQPQLSFGPVGSYRTQQYSLVVISRLESSEIDPGAALQVWAIVWRPCADCMHVLMKSCALTVRHIFQKLSADRHKGHCFQERPSRFHNRHCYHFPTQHTIILICIPLQLYCFHLPGAPLGSSWQQIISFYCTCPAEKKYVAVCNEPNSVACGKQSQIVIRSTRRHIYSAQSVILFWSNYELHYDEEHTNINNWDQTWI